MAYVRDKVHLLTWEGDHELAGLEMRARAIPLREYLELDSIISGRALPERFTTADEAIDWVFGRFASALVSWSLHDREGRPVPPDLDGVMSQDREFVMIVLRDWIEALRTVAAPLPKPSPASERSAEASIPMESLSASPVS